MRRALLAPLVAATLVLVLVGGSAHTRRHSTPVATRREIARQVGASYQGLAFGNVACPDGVARKADRASPAPCSSRAMFLVFDATQTDGRGTVSFENTQAVMTRSAVEQFVAAKRAARGDGPCGNRGGARRAAGRPAHLPGEHRRRVERTVQLTVRDTAGNVTITGVT